MNYPRIKLGEVAIIRGGKRLPAGKAFTTVATPHPYIRARDIGGGKIEINDPVFLDTTTAQKLFRYTVNSGDVCITIVGANVGEMGIVPLKLHGANLTENVGSIFWCDDDFYVIDTAYFVTSSLLPLRFLFYVLPTLNFINSDAAVPGLSRNQAYTLEIFVPSAALLAKFCALADTFEQQVTAFNRQIQNLRRTRDLLLPRLLSGDLRISKTG